MVTDYPSWKDGWYPEQAWHVSHLNRGWPGWLAVWKRGGTGQWAPQQWVGQSDRVQQTSERIGATYDIAAVAQR